MIGSTTRLLVLLGDPTEHSLSPAIQNPAIEAAGLNAVYVALRCETGDVGGLIRGIARGGGGGNVTLPHKETAARSLDRASEWVELTGACNTFWLEEGRIHGENTDVAGFRGAVASLIGRSTAGLRVLLLGSGGASRAALAGLLADGAGEILVWNRTQERAHTLTREVGGGRARVVPDVSDAGPERIDLVVNATSLGLDERDPLPFDPGSLPGTGGVLDLVYRPGETPLVRRSRELGIPAADGGEMLVLQGAEAFRIWWNRPPPVDAMRSALARARRPETRR